MSELGDLLRVLRELDAKDADADRAAEMLGLRYLRPARPVRPFEASKERSVAGEHPEPGIEEERSSPPEETPLPISVEWRGAPAEIRPAWLVGSEPLHEDALQYRRARIELDPLLQPLSTRAILSALVATPSEGAPDIDALIASIAAGEPVQRLRYLIALTVTRGVQVLVDRSPSMTPFRHDQRHLVAQLQRVIGAPRVSVLDFMECPTRGAGTGTIDRWTSYEPPPPRTPVLLLSDLGIGRELHAGATTREWRSFASDVRASGSPLLALVPYASRRWPRALLPFIAMAQWDRGLTARAARRTARPASRRR